MSVSLSSLPRAALAAKEGYGWIHVLALAYCVVIGIFSVGAWLSDGHAFRAAICAGAQLLSVVMALLARRALTGQMVIGGIICGGIAFGFSTWAAAGLEHAWAANGATIQDWQVWFLTGSEPAIFLLIEHIKEGRETLRAAHKKHEQELAEELAAIRARSANPEQQRPPRQPFQPEVVEGGRVAATGLAVASAATGQAQAQPVDLSAVQPLVARSVAHSAMTYADADAHAADLLKRALSQREVSRQTGLTRYRVSQIAASMAAA